MSPVLRRIVAAFGAHSFGQAINIFIQLASLPLFLSKWDTATYGIWLLLSAMPSYLSMADGGLVTAAANKLSMAYAQNQIEVANRVFQSTLCFILATCSLVWVAVFVAIFYIEIPGVSETDRKIALLCLATSVLVAQFNGLAETIFRAEGRHAQGIMMGNISRLLEWTGLITGLFLFGTLTGVAATGLLLRLIGLTTIYIASTKVGSNINWGFSLASRKEVRELIRPALSFMAFPLSNALSIQGITILVGHMFGPVAVTIFNTYRTISRIALQVTGTLGNSLWAEFSRLYATGGAAAVLPVYQRASLLGGVAALLVSLALIVIAPYLLSVWSRNAIAFDFALMMLMLSYAAVGGLWNVARTLLMAINNHSNLSKLAVAAALLSIGICHTLGHLFNLNGVAAGILVIEIGMALICITSAHRVLHPAQNKKHV